MLAQQAEVAPVNAQTLEDIQKHLESATLELYWREPQWDQKQDAALAIIETIRRVQQARSALPTEECQDALQHLESALHALRHLTGIDFRCPATPEQQANFELAWDHLEKTRVSLCSNLYERMRPGIGSIKDAPPDLPSRPYMMKHGLWPKEDWC